MADNDLGPSRVAVMGDTHCNTRWVCSQIPLIADKLKDQDRKVIIQLGDFGYWPREEPGGQWFLTQVNATLAAHDMELWFIDGNHEDHDGLAGVENAWSDLGGDLPASIALPGFSRIRWLTRGHRWWWQGRQWMAMGGATSLDRLDRAPGRDWFAAEAITDGQVQHAVASGPVDVLITHDCPASVVHAHPDYGFPHSEIRRAEEHAQILQGVVDGTQPKWIIHGHLHILYSRYAEQVYGPSWVTGLGMDGMPGNWFILNTETMRWETDRHKRATETGSS